MPVDGIKTLTGNQSLRQHALCAGNNIADEYLKQMVLKCGQAACSTSTCDNSCGVAGAGMTDGRAKREKTPSSCAIISRHAAPAECQVEQDSKPKFGVEK